MELSQSSEGSYYNGMYADPPVVKRVPLREAATISTFLTGDDGTVQIAIDATVQCDFSRELQQPIKVIDVDSVLFRDPKSKTTEGDIRHSLNKDAKAFWIGRAQVYADNLGTWEVNHIRDKVRASVALHGN